MSEPEGPPPPEVNLDPLEVKRKEFGGLSTTEAIVKIAQSLNEMNAKLAVQPLANQPKGSAWDVVGKIAEAIANVAPRLQGGGGGEMEKRALETFFKLGETTMETQILTNRAMARRLGLDVLKEVPHVVVQG